MLPYGGHGGGQGEQTGDAADGMSPKSRMALSARVGVHGVTVGDTVGDMRPRVVHPGYGRAVASGYGGVASLDAGGEH